MVPKTGGLEQRGQQHEPGSMKIKGCRHIHVAISTNWALLAEARASRYSGAGSVP